MEKKFILINNQTNRFKKKGNIFDKMDLYNFNKLAFTKYSKVCSKDNIVELKFKLI